MEPVITLLHLPVEQKSENAHLSLSLSLSLFLSFSPSLCALVFQDFFLRKYVLYTNLGEGVAHSGSMHTVLRASHVYKDEDAWVPSVNSPKP